MALESIHVAIYDTWADWEAGFALAHLASGDWQPGGRKYRIVTVAESLEPVRTKGGMTLVPDININALDPGQSAMLILPGADSWLTGANTAFVEAAGRFLEAGVPVAAICGATIGLARGGLLNDVAHTSNALQLLESAEYTGHDRYQHELAVRDGSLITASAIGPVEFARAIFDALEFYPESTSDNWYLMYGRQEAAGFFGLMEGMPHG